MMMSAASESQRVGLRAQTPKSKKLHWGLGSLGSSQSGNQLETLEVTLKCLKPNLEVIEKYGTEIGKSI